MIKEIRKVFKEGRYEYSLHALDQSILRHITRREILESIEKGEIIENYPEDKFGPSCLIYGRTDLERPLHIHCSYPTRPKIKIITVYEPDSAEWIDFKTRR
ncbi:MAG: DUF4258 domain-containing protein [Candidatus Omnitrophica bacterium]|nr:DUF4258 domain-containing protein [Candidatus Omnitrophota bacterium]MBU4418308.1 DUF4258 domain-containing protein [Candidatus Omnitrophota bacterium]MBU4468548.1 DUF4258 domain-containing protein [Candidatus Omnitrophota bacterium]MCG2707763.1 DUF4258 domain-containing protein [Candidatus Omnitrophota bacterium]